MGMCAYDRWKTTDPRDTVQNARISDAYADAGWTDPKLYPAINAFEKFVGPFMQWLQDGTEGWDEAPAFYRWLVEGVGCEWNFLEGEICEHWLELAGSGGGGYGVDFPDDWDSIGAIEAVRSVLPTDVIEGL